MLHRGFRLNVKWLLLVTVLALGAVLLAACGGLIAVVLLILLALNSRGVEPDEMPDSRSVNKQRRTEKDQVDKQPAPDREPGKTPSPPEQAAPTQDGEARYQALLAALQQTKDLVKQNALIDAYLTQPPPDRYRTKLEALRQSLREQLSFNRSTNEVRARLAQLAAIRGVDLR